MNKIIGKIRGASSVGSTSILYIKRKFRKIIGILCDWRCLEHIKEEEEIGNLITIYAENYQILSKKEIKKKSIPII